MDIASISVGDNPPYEVNVIIEIPQGGAPVKYEIDKKSGAMFVDRFLHTAMFYPANYGFIPHTLSEDGDPVDCLVVAPTPVAPGVVIRARPIGALLMEDEKGIDEKIIAVPTDKLHPFYKRVGSYRDLPEIVIEQIGHFFEHYKDLEKGKWVKLLRWAEPSEAAELIRAGIDRGIEHGVGGRDLGVVLDHADAVEHEGHGARLGEVAAALGEIGAHVGSGAVAVVGQRLDDDGDAPRAVALVANLVIGFGLAAQRLLDGALDIVLRHVLRPRRDDRRAQPRIHARVGRAELRRDRDFAGELAEQLGAHRVLPALAVHDVLELRMSGHVTVLNDAVTPSAIHRKLAHFSTECLPPTLIKGRSPGSPQKYDDRTRQIL